MIPAWLVQLGSIAGLLAFGLTILDRLFKNRPLAWISPDKYGRQVLCKNMATCDITINKIKCYPSNITAASGDSLDATVRAAAGQSFVAILKTDEERGFPLSFSRGELMDKGCKEIAPFMVVISWRRNSSYWLPQIPKFIVSSARAMRALQSAK
jgi:hypothetical protein